MNKKELIELQRDTVIHAYKYAINDNKIRYNKGDYNATSEYTYNNQKEDALKIINYFYIEKCRVVSVAKKTKVGMDGLIIEIITNFATHSDDDFIIDYNNVRIITGMSNALWEKNLKNKIPKCFEDKIFHHGQLQHVNLNLNDLNNGLIIIDEIDCGGKEDQKLHQTLRDFGILNIDNIEKNNLRIVLTSATMITEILKLDEWKKNLYRHIQMTIPSNYLSHKDMLDRKLIDDSYPLNKEENVKKWLKDDILNNYKDDYRIHIVRLNIHKNSNNINLIRDLCEKYNIYFYDYSREGDIKTEKEIEKIFNETINNHTVIGIKGLFRRANLIPNKWKLKIGATHELHTEDVDYSVQIQGLTGRMTGYWKDVVDSGFKTGPHRTSIKAIIEYENVYNNPFNKKHNYKKNNEDTFVDKKLVKGSYDIQNNQEEKNHKIFIFCKKQEDASLICHKYFGTGKDYGKKVKFYPMNIKDLKYGDHPSEEQFINGGSGLGDKYKVRTFKTNNNTYVVYWWFKDLNKNNKNNHQFECLIKDLIKNTEENKKLNFDDFYKLLETVENNKTRIYIENIIT
jgi:hypothetical protein